jgi:hypothetical protein
MTADEAPGGYARGICVGWERIQEANNSGSANVDRRWGDVAYRRSGVTGRVLRRMVKKSGMQKKRTHPARDRGEPE